MEKKNTRAIPKTVKEREEKKSKEVKTRKEVKNPVEEEKTRKVRREEHVPTEEERRERKRREDRKAVEDDQERMDGLFFQLSKLKCKSISKSKEVNDLLVSKQDRLESVEGELTRLEV